MAKGVTADMGGYELLVSFTFTLRRGDIGIDAMPTGSIDLCPFWGFNVMLAGSILGLFVRGLSERDI